MSTFSLRIGTCPKAFNYTNRVYVNKKTFTQLEAQARRLEIRISSSDPSLNLEIGSFIFQACANDTVADGEVAMNGIQRKSCVLELNASVSVSIFVPNADVALSDVKMTVDTIVKKKDAPRLELNGDELTAFFKTHFGSQVFSVGQGLGINFNGTYLDLAVESFEHAAVGVGGGSRSRNQGQILEVTTISWKKNPAAINNIVVTGSAATMSTNTNLFRGDFDFGKMGIGGLDEQFTTMFRRAFASRIFPGLVKQLGINHIRGILLYGPPGCGKTLIARQIGKVLNAREPKIINGPEVLDKFVGGSEEKVRALFADAEKEQAERGDASMLHIIIFDEMDAVMKARGSTRDSTGVSDSIVNQLLSKIDGVDALNNILIIGMTNRKDMIDEAILRPGRLELHIEIGLPSEAGRAQIINIHTKSMRESNRLHPDVTARMGEIAAGTKNFTGAEIEGMVRIAASFVLARNTDASNLGKSAVVDDKDLKVEWRDFERAMRESVPAFGAKDNEEIMTHFRNGVCRYGPNFDEIWSTLQRLMTQTRTSQRTPLMSLLLEGPAGTGKTAIAAKMAAESDFPFVRMISADSMIGFSESQKCSTLLKVFTDSYKSSHSIIFIDDIERILEYTPIGPRFSNILLQTLLILIRKAPPFPSRLLVVATTSIAHLLEDLQLTRAFTVSLNLSALQDHAEIQAVLNEYSSLSPADVAGIARAITKPIGVKMLLTVLEMARAENGGNDSFSQAQFLHCLHTVGF